MCDTTGATSLSLRNPRPDLPKPDSLTQHPHPSTNNNNHNQTNSHKPTKHPSNSSVVANDPVLSVKQNQVGTVLLFGVPIVSLVMDGKERLCLAQISSTLLKEFSYNEIHNRRVALGITCVQCTPVQLEILRRAGAMPVTSRRCGMITRREAERLCQSFLGDHAPPQLPENFAFEVYHECGWGCRGSFVPSRYNSSRAKCIRCTYCQLFFSPNKFIFHSHRLPDSRYVQPDAANFNSWRRHLKLCGDPPEDDASSNTLSMDTAQIVHAWEDVRAMFNGGTRKRMLAAHHHHHTHTGGSEGHPHMRRSLKSSNSNNARSHTPHPLQSQQQASQSTQQTHQRAGNDHFQQNSPQTNHNQSTQSSQQGQPARVESPSIPTTPNNFLTVPSPLLSPSGRLETIWNPGIGNHPSAHKGLNLPSTVPHLPFHPLALPWLRRPLFPFPHPFSPCHLLTADPNSATISTPISEKLHSGVAERILNHSAFKPVSRANAEQLFTWLNNNNTLLGPNHSTGILNSFNPSQTSLPEDLSLHPGVGILAAHPSQGCSLKSPLISATSERLAGERKELAQGAIIGSLDLPSVSIPSVSSTIEETSPTSLDQSPPGRGRGNNVTSSSGSCGRHHQIHILSTAGEDDSDDDENVDIESTEVDECCSSTSSINWMGNNRGLPVDQKVCDFTRKRKRSCDTFSDDNQDDYEDAKDSDLDEENFTRVSKLTGKNNSIKQKMKRIWDLGNGTGNPRQIMSCSPTPNSK